MKFLKKSIVYFTLFFFAYFMLNALRIYNYSSEYSEEQSDVAIVLGAAINNGTPSPVFRERINHSIYLYKKGVIDKVIYTGEGGKGHRQSESEVAMLYAISKGVKKEEILMEKMSEYTTQHLSEAIDVLTSHNLTIVLLISDPLHMKGGMLHAEN